MGSVSGNGGGSKPGRAVMPAEPFAAQAPRSAPAPVLERTDSTARDQLAPRDPGGLGRAGSPGAEKRPHSAPQPLRPASPKAGVSASNPRSVQRSSAAKTSGTDVPASQKDQADVPAAPPAAPAGATDAADAADAAAVGGNPHQVADVPAAPPAAPAGATDAADAAGAAAVGGNPHQVAPEEKVTLLQAVDQLPDEVSAVQVKPPNTVEFFWRRASYSVSPLEAFQGATTAEDVAKAAAYILAKSNPDAQSVQVTFKPGADGSPLGSYFASVTISDPDSPNRVRTDTFPVPANNLPLLTAAKIIMGQCALPASTAPDVDNEDPQRVDDASSEGRSEPLRMRRRDSVASSADFSVVTIAPLSGEHVSDDHVSDPPRSN